jgi:Pentacotripeptide-repeat region of PRORP
MNGVSLATAEDGIEIGNRKKQQKQPFYCNNNMNDKPQSPPPAASAQDERRKKRPLQQEDDSSVKIATSSPAGTTCATNATQEKTDKKMKQQNNNKKKGMDPDALQLRITIQQCCAKDDLSTAIQAYDAAVKKGTTILAQCFYNLLALCDGLAERETSIHIGTPKTIIIKNSNGDQEIDNTMVVATTPVDERSSSNVENKNKQKQKEVSCDVVVSMDERKRHAFRIKAHMDALQIPATEPVYTSLVKLLCKTQTQQTTPDAGDELDDQARNLDEAEALLQQAKHVQQCRPKLRMYAPLLTAYCKRVQLNQALCIWLQLSKQDLQLTEREYASLIACATQYGNGVVMERVLSDLAEDVLVPSRGTCRAVAEWFQSPAATTTTTTAAAAAAAAISEAQHIKNNGDESSHHQQPDGDSTISVQDFLKQIRIPQQSFPSPNMGPVHTPNGWTICNACSIDTRTGILQSGCLQGERLLPIAISPEHWQEMKDANETIVLQGGLQQHAAVPFQGGRKGKKKLPRNADDMSERSRHWQQFQDFLSAYTKRNINKIDIVIDGANVGYYRRSFPDAPKHVDYAQIAWIVEHFQKQHKSVLLIMHSRHFSRSLMPREFEVRASHLVHFEFCFPGENML